ncbi:putative Xaa-Pro aminopeptidase pepP [Viridothelium virens]|uniref:Xaa-Pro aminopeptidase n=1 Tax=Viridothelium virens TaxID=1048519 RepID=A0A6A6HGU4_VIRVR|nr:putative Xaa-Pro aminopeptidase pepP [Viridothelium virens]
MDAPPKKDPILNGKYPAKQHAHRVVEWIVANGGEKKGVIYLEGQKTMMIEDKDQAQQFHQRRYFYYLTGCPIPESYFTYDIEADKSTLYIPPVDPDEVIWSGLPVTVEEAAKLYDVDEVLENTSIKSHISSLSTLIYTMEARISPDLHLTSPDFHLLRHAIDHCRVRKDAYEIALIRHANAVSSRAHEAVLRAARHAPNEQNLYGLFLQKCIAQGCHDQAYHSIVAAGHNCATLHYIYNDRALESKLNLLIDAGAEYQCYAADVTRTFPISGRFTRESREVYGLVLEMQRVTMGMCRSGLRWEEAHERAHEIAIDGLLGLGILKGEKKEIWEKRISTAFFPHGLGHYLGMDTHDVGGNANYADEDPMFRYLRIRGEVPDGAVVTVEPGIYFCRFIIEPFLEDEKTKGFIDETVLEKYWDVGGVRIEDDVLIKRDGFENLTDVGRSIEEVEALMAEG